MLVSGCGDSKNGDGQKSPFDKYLEENDDVEEKSQAPRVLTDKDFLYLHDNYLVTDGIFDDKNIIFDTITADWKAFCHEVLHFEIPDFIKK